jgi:hypothetical protein
MSPEAPSRVTEREAHLSPAEPVIIERESSTTLARLDSQALLSTALERGAAIDVIERIVALAERVNAIQAREAYNAAIAEFQRRCPPIYKTREATITPRGGGAGYTYTYAPLPEIKATIDPLLGELGLSQRWTSPVVEANRVTIECVIMHRLGHEISSGPVTMPVSQAQDGGGGANQMQRVAIAMSYAKRQALQNVLGIAPEDDDDGASVEDTTGATDDRHPPLDPHKGPSAPIDAQQVRRFGALAGDAKWTDEQIHELLTSFGYDRREAIKDEDFAAICDRLKLGHAAWTAKRRAS